MLLFLVYDSPEAVEFGFKEWEDVFEKREANLNVLFDTVYSKVDAVVDLPHSYFFDAFFERWPNAKVFKAKCCMHQRESNLIQDQRVLDQAN